MTISDQTSYQVYTATGLSANFVFNHPCRTPQELTVKYKADANTAEVTWAYLTNFTVSGVPDSNGHYPNGLTVVASVMPPSGATISIERSVALTQTAEYSTSDRFPAKTHEKALDKLTMITQDLKRLISRSFLIPATSGLSSLTFPSPAANKAIGWNSNGTQLINDPADFATTVSTVTTKASEAAASATAASNSATAAAASAAEAAASAGILTDPELVALAGLASAANKLPYFTGSGTAALADLSPFMRSLLGATNAADLRADAGLEIGTNVQAYDTELSAIAGLASADNKVPYFTGSGTAALADFTAFGRTLTGAADAAVARTALVLGALATKSAVDLGTGDATGNIPVARFNSGTNAAAHTAWFGGGTWDTPKYGTLTGFATGRFYCQYTAASVTVGAAGEGIGGGANRAVAVPFYVPITRTFDRIGVHINTAVGGSTVALAIYNSTNGYPSTRLLDAGTVDSSSTGVKTITINQQLTPGWYWLSASASNAGVGITRLTSLPAFASLQFGLSAIASATGSLAVAGAVSDTSAAAPAVFTSSPTFITDPAQIPVIYLRAT